MPYYSEDLTSFIAGGGSPLQMCAETYVYIHVKCPSHSTIFNINDTARRYEISCFCRGVTSSFFSDVKKRQLVVSYRHFGTTYLPILNGQAVQQ